MYGWLADALSEDSPLPEAPSPPAITKGPVQLSTLVPSKDSVTVKDDGVVELKLVEGEVCLSAVFSIVPD
jgi:hypothetical protein